MGHAQFVNDVLIVVQIGRSEIRRFFVRFLHRFQSQTFSSTSSQIASNSLLSRACVVHERQARGSHYLPKTATIPIPTRDFRTVFKPANRNEIQAAADKFTRRGVM